MSDARNEVLRILCFSEACGFASHRSRFTFKTERDALDQLVKEGVVLTKQDFYCFSQNPTLLDLAEQSRQRFPRKLHRALEVVQVAKWLGSIRFVALCNAVSMRSIRAESDVDLFFICRSKSLWITRFLLTGYLALRGWRVDQGDTDPVCLTFFIDDKHMDLAPLAIERDIYLAEWSRSLMPLLDDGIQASFVKSQSLFKDMATIWPKAPSRLPMVRIPTTPLLDSFAKFISLKKLSPIIKEQMNRTSAVIVTDQMLKFHLDDARITYRDRYEALCHQHGITP